MSAQWRVQANFIHSEWLRNSESGGKGISPRRASMSGVTLQSRASGAAVSRVRREGLVRMGSGPLGASAAATAFAWAFPTSVRPGSGLSEPAFPWRTR
jgi:hypothetical protein